MEDLFNIFGSSQAVKLATVDRYPCQTVPAAKGLLPAKSNNVGGASSKGKKVLCDVSNKMKGLSSKPINKSDDILKKPLQVNKGITENKPEHKGVKPKNKLHEMLENHKSATHTLPSSSCDRAEWPEVETQGPCFWDDEKCSDILWPKSDWPTLEDFSKIANIWENENRSFSLTPSPPPEFNNDLQFCLDLPQTSLHIPLDEMTVPLPWEL